MAQNADLIVIEPVRRDFLRLTAGAMGAVGLGAAAWPFIDSLNPAADAFATQWRFIDLGELGPGERMTLVLERHPDLHRAADTAGDR
jgi:ubiquinol-cytochrome c reductase iron-sulfur subunit